MQKSTGKLRIHTAMEPIVIQAEPAVPKKIKLQWNRSPKPKPKAEAQAPMPKAAKLTKQQQQPRPKQNVGVASAQKKLRPRLTSTEKLLRNSAVACALLLSVMALQNVDHPWTKTTTEKIKQAVTMRIDLDESLGRLNFVRGLVPEAALVFWNMGDENKLTPPVSGTVSHEYADMQPWIEFVCTAQQPVVAANTGTVVAVGQGATGDWTLMLEHEGGEQTVYAYLGQALVKVGQSVDKGAQVGVTQDLESSRLYFELRKDGVPENPSKRM